MTEKVSEEMLMALADGELDAETTRRLRARIETDPGLRARFERYARSAEAVRAVFADTLNTPPPDRLVAALRAAPVGTPAEIGTTSGNVASLDAARKRRWGSGWGALPLAATVALAAGLGFLLGQSGGDTPAGASTDSMARLHAAAEALADAPSGEIRELADGSRAAVLASFDTSDGACRQIQLRAPDGGVWESLGCHGTDGWRIALVLPEQATGGYVPAEGARAGALDAYLAGVNASAPLDEGAEADRIGRGWTAAD